MKGDGIEAGDFVTHPIADAVERLSFHPLSAKADLQDRLIGAVLVCPEEIDRHQLKVVLHPR